MWATASNVGSAGQWKGGWPLLGVIDHGNSMRRIVKLQEKQSVPEAFEAVFIKCRIATLFRTRWSCLAVVMSDGRRITSGQKSRIVKNGLPVPPLISRFLARRRGLPQTSHVTLHEPGSPHRNQASNKRCNIAGVSSAVS